MLELLSLLPHTGKVSFVTGTILRSRTCSLRHQLWPSVELDRLLPPFNIAGAGPGEGVRVGRPGWVPLPTAGPETEELTPVLMDKGVGAIDRLSGVVVPPDDGEVLTFHSVFSYSVGLQMRHVLRERIWSRAMIGRSIPPIRPALVRVRQSTR